MRDEGESRIAAIIAEAEIAPPAPAADEHSKPRLQVEPCDPHRTVETLRDILAQQPGLFDRGVPVRIAVDRTAGGVAAHPLTPDSIVLLAHQVSRPFAIKSSEQLETWEVATRLPRSIASMYLDWRGEWKLPVLNGIAASPLLHDDGSIRCASGYDERSGFWLERVPSVSLLVPDRPTRDQAQAALLQLRESFASFCFGDSPTTRIPDIDVELVDTALPPGEDESALLAALMTAVCRPSLDLAPGVLIRSAPLSGAGSGKGLLARCISLIAFGREPHAVTCGVTAQELEKRLAAELIAGGAVLFLDNLNNRALRSDLLASALTEKTARVRILGRSEMAQLNPTALVVITGNGLSVVEDLARRFITIELDAKTEDPETRRFPGDIRRDVAARRDELMAAALTIWRWGRLVQDVPKGRPLGSFEQWCSWVRDPLVALGCADPVVRTCAAKQRDSQRQSMVEIFQTWSRCHGQAPRKASELHDEVKRLIDPQGGSRQALAKRLENLAGTRIAGFVLTRQPAPGRWGTATYALMPTDDQQSHRGYRDHGSYSASEPTERSDEDAF